LLSTAGISGDDKHMAPGMVLIMVKSVSPELYNYLFFYEKYKSDIGSVLPGNSIPRPGNIQNGPRHLRQQQQTAMDILF